MISRWSRGKVGDQVAPVEMRFIDMFMTALGSLLFIGLLLVFLLPKAMPRINPLQNARVQDGPSVAELQSALADNGVLRTKLKDVLADNNTLNAKFYDMERTVQRLQSAIDDLQREREQLRDKLARDDQHNSEDKKILRRWLSIFLLVRGCEANEPELYVRWEGPLIDWETGKPAPDAALFDASSPGKKTILFGHRYFDIGPPPPAFSPSVFFVPFNMGSNSYLGIRALDDNGLQAKIFQGIARQQGTVSVYAGLDNPHLQGNTKCVVNPIYLSSKQLIYGQTVILDQRHPFAWLRRLEIDSDGLLKSPGSLDEFVRGLKDFSAKQADALCKEKSLCGTVDAQLAEIERIRLSKPAEANSLTSEQESTLKPTHGFKECDQCPDMVVIPTGSFLMGSPDTEKSRTSDEGPQRTVTIGSRIAVGRFAVTFDEWDACVDDGACNAYRPADQGWGRGRRPVINVSWLDAKAYVRWLSHKTGKTYRLLSEAEREYVTRAGTNTPFWWGPASSTSDANYDGRFTYGNTTRGRYEQKTMPVDSFRPNAWGLYQVHGNVWEWVEDCWSTPYHEAIRDGSPWLEEDCHARVRRGGSWRNNPQFLRSAVRGPSQPDGRYDNIGFRVARTL